MKKDYELLLKKICLLEENVPLERFAYVKIDVSQIDVMSEK